MKISFDIEDERLPFEFQGPNGHEKLFDFLREHLFLKQISAANLMKSSLATKEYSAEVDRISRTNITIGKLLMESMSFDPPLKKI